MSRAAAEIAAIERELEEVFGAMIRHPAFLKKSGSLPDDPAHFTDRADISTLLRRMDRLVSRVGGKLASFDWQNQMAKRYPREERYRAQQSVKDRSAPFRQLYQRVVGMLDELLKLQADNNRVSFLDAFGAAHENAGENLKTFQKFDELASQMQAKGLTATVQTISSADHHIAKFNAQQTGAYNIPINVVLAMAVVIAAAVHWRRGTMFG